jgi:MFS family permease
LSSQRYGVLLAAFLGWMFAGLEISLFILVHRQMMLELLGTGAQEKVITQWFAWYQAAFLFGAASGGWIFGWLGDHLGRTKALGLSILCYSLLTLVCYFVADARLMLVVRLLACMGIGGVWPNAVALVAEAWPNASRPFLAGFLGAAANVGFVLLGLIGYQFAISVESWRWVLLVGASPLLLACWVLLVVPESVRWLLSREQNVGQPRRTAPIIEVFRPPLLSHTLFGIALGAIPVIGTAANANWIVPWTDQAAERRLQNAAPPAANAVAAPPKKKADDARRQKAITQMTRSGGAIFGSLLGGMIAARLGRRLTYFLISLGALAVSSYIFTQLDPLQPRFQMWSFLLGFVGVTYFGWLPLFLPELFPTRVRSTGSGISFNTGRIVAACVVLSTGALIDWFDFDYARIGFWSGMIYAAGMLIIWFAPMSSSGKLED